MTAAMTTVVVAAAATLLGGASRGKVIVLHWLYRGFNINTLVTTLEAAAAFTRYKPRSSIWTTEGHGLYK